MNSVVVGYQIGTVAQILKISRPLAMRLVRQGGLPAQRTPQGLRVEHGILTGWIDDQMRQAALEARGLAKEGQKP